MPKTATLTIHLDSALKQKTEKLFQEMGLTPAQAITLFYKQVNTEHKIPFPISDDEYNEPNEETLQAIEDSILGRNLKTFNSVEEALKDLEI